MLDAFTPKRISPNCPFKSYQRLSQILILTLRCAVWLRGVRHTAQLDSEVWCTPRSLTPWCAAHRGAWLRGRKHTAELDSAVGSTQRIFWESWYPWLRGVMHTMQLGSAVGCKLLSQTDSKVSVFCFLVLASCYVFRLNFFEKLLK